MRLLLFCHCGSDAINIIFQNKSSDDEVVVVNEMVAVTSKPEPDDEFDDPYFQENKVQVKHHSTSICAYTYLFYVYKEFLT